MIVLFETVNIAESRVFDHKDKKICTVLKIASRVYIILF